MRSLEKRWKRFSKRPIKSISYDVWVKNKPLAKLRVLAENRGSRIWLMQSCKDIPTMRLHLWLETGDGLFFGFGRTQLLEKIDQYGSLKRAAEEMGMSYRAAWGKIMKTEEVLGFKVIERAGSSNKAGYHLTESGKMLLEKFKFWFDEVEKNALTKAAEIFPWPIAGFEEEACKKASPPPKTKAEKNVLKA
jgi:molybdate transport system regulatory protein